MKSRSRTLFIAVGWVTSLVMVVMAVSYAAIPDSNGIIRGCYDEEGFVRIVDGNCEAFEESITWKAKGPDALEPSRRTSTYAPAEHVALYIGADNQLTRVAGLSFMQGCEPKVPSPVRVGGWGLCRFTGDASKYEPQFNWLADILEGRAASRQVLLVWAPSGNENNAAQACRAPRRASPDQCLRGSGTPAESLLCNAATLVAFRVGPLGADSVARLGIGGLLTQNQIERPFPFQWDIELGECTLESNALTPLTLTGRTAIGRDVADSYETDVVGISGIAKNLVTIEELSISLPRTSALDEPTFEATLRVPENKSSIIRSWILGGSKKTLVLEVHGLRDQMARPEIIDIDISLESALALPLDLFPRTEGKDFMDAACEEELYCPRRFLVFPASVEVTEQAPKQ